MPLHVKVEMVRDVRFVAGDGTGATAFYPRGDPSLHANRFDVVESIALHMVASGGAVPLAVEPQVIAEEGGRLASDAERAACLERMRALVPLVEVPAPPAAPAPEPAPAIAPPAAELEPREDAPTPSSTPDKE